tara:strand:+ start:208 stop:468 length:261 start_codon:yes stop_codon:yes gene_type:complete
MNERKFVGSGKKVGNYDLINFTINEEMTKDAWFDYNGKRYLKLTIGNKKEVDQYGKTHSVWLDEFKPDEKKVEQPAKPLPTPDLPF